MPVTAAHPHKDHRARLRGRFLASGLLDFAPHNVLELVLFYSIPRRDTNPIAHALLDAFGSVTSVLTAERSRLLEVSGIGDGTVRLLAALRDILAVADEGNTRRQRTSSAGALGSLFCHLLSGLEGEATAVVFLDNALGVIGHRLLPGVSPHAPRFSFAAVSEESIRLRAAHCAIAHLHADGLALPVTADLDMARTARRVLDGAGVHLLELYIVSGKRYSTLLYRTTGCSQEEASVASAGDGAERAALAALLSAGGVSEDAAGLIERYGGLYPLLSLAADRRLAPTENKRVSALLALPFSLYTYGVAERRLPRPDDVTGFGAYLTDFYRYRSSEELILFLFDKKGNHIATRTVGVGGIAEAPFSRRQIAECAVYANASLAILAHNHHAGLAEPSEEDREATVTIEQTLSGVGVKLLRHYIVAGSDFSTLM